MVALTTTISTVLREPCAPGSTLPVCIGVIAANGGAIWPSHAPSDAGEMCTVIRTEAPGAVDVVPPINSFFIDGQGEVARMALRREEQRRPSSA